MRVLHVITALNTGGAELMLHNLVRASLGGPLSHEVVSLMDRGPVAERIAALGVPVHAVGMSRGARCAARMPRLVALVRRLRPDVVQTWMYHADLLGGVAARAAGSAAIVWGLHSATLGEGVRRTTRWTAALCARLSRHVPDAIVSVSRAAADVHAAAGYDARKLVVIPNGFDVARFRPDEGARASVRRELGLDARAVVVGLVARVHPQKDHATFVRAAASLARRRPDVRFLLCGDGTDRREIAEAVSREGLLARFLLLGRRDDVPRVLAALDVATLSSYAEAFPLAVGEAMACGVPCAVTDVGDCAHLVGEAGRVVSPRDPEALARAWEELVALGDAGRRRLGLAARERIVERFSLPRVVDAYASLYRRVLSRSGRPALSGPLPGRDGSLQRDPAFAPADESP